jgi:CBS domain-containing protein
VVARIQPEKRGNIINALRQMGKPPSGKETAYELMSPGPLTTLPDLSVVDAVKKMLKESRKWLVVIDDQQHPLGLVNRQHLLEAMAVFPKEDPQDGLPG